MVSSGEKRFNKLLFFFFFKKNTIYTVKKLFTSLTAFKIDHTSESLILLEAMFSDRKV